MQTLLHVAAELTGYFQGCIVTDRLAQIVSCHTHVTAVVGLAPPSVDDTQEEEGAAGQQHALRAGIIPVRFHPLAILVPLHRRGRPPLRFAVERGGLPLGDDQVRGVLHDPGCGVLLAQTGS